MSEIWIQLKPQLELFSRPFPRAAINLANAHREEVAPHLIACLEAIATDPAPTLNPVYMLHQYALHLLACWRDTRAYPAMVKIGHYPEEIIDSMLGDAVSETYGRALASVCDGDLRPLEALVEDVEACIWARKAALRAMTVRALEGDADRASVIAYFTALGEREALRLKAPEGEVETFELIDGIVSNATDIGAVSLLPAIRQWFADGLLDESIAGERWVAEHIMLSPEQCLADLRRYNNSYLLDVVKEMSWWSGFKEDKAPSSTGLGSTRSGKFEFEQVPSQGFAARPETIVRGTPKIGRNDPCHCGSGCKYKKCHGAAV